MEVFRSRSRPNRKAQEEQWVPEQWVPEQERWRWKDRSGTAGRLRRSSGAAPIPGCCEMEVPQQYQLR